MMKDVGNVIRNEVCYKECVKAIEEFKDNREYMKSALVAVFFETVGSDSTYVLFVCDVLGDDYLDIDISLSKDIYSAFRQYKAFIKYRKVLRERKIHMKGGK